MPPALAFALGALGPFLLASSYTLNHFYVDGAYFLDSGWFAHLALHGAAVWPLANPPVLGGTYFATHVAPLFYAIAGVARLLGVESGAIAFALSQGLWFGLLGGTTAAVLRSWLEGGVGRGLALVGLAWASGMSGVSLAILGFPHFEIAIPALALLALVLLIRRRHIACAAVVALCLLTREDAGLHLFTLYGAAALVAALAGPGRSGLTRAHGAACLCVALVGLAVSLALVAVAAWLWPGDGALRRTYLGEPPLAHVTWGLVVDRLDGLMRFRAYLWAPALVVLAAALVARAPLYLVGLLAPLPWIALHVLAVDDQAGILTGYRAFPIVFTVLAPVIVAAAAARRRDATGRPAAGGARPRHPLWAQAGVVAVSLAAFPFAAWVHDAHPWERFPPRWIAAVGPVGADVAGLFARRDALGELLVDDGVASLAPDRVRPGEWHYLFANIPAARRHRVDTIAWFEPSPFAPEIEHLARARGLTVRLHLPSSRIRLVTRPEIARPLDLDATGMRRAGRSAR